MEKQSQAVPLASNPQTAQAMGLNNQPLNNNASAGVTPTELSDFLAKLIHHGNRPSPEILSLLGKYISLVKDDSIKSSLSKIGNALHHANIKRKSTRDPLTNKKDPDAVELATRLKTRVDALKKNTSKPKGASTVYNHKTAQTVIKKKKKTRGNPFRVLMGKVGKLLDHGVEKNDIVRYLAKLKYWNNETIERAVDIVRDYNKKKKHDTDKDNKDNKEASTNSKIVTSALDYDRQPDFHKKSTGELIFRVCFLLDVLENDKETVQPLDKDPIGKKEAKSEIALLKKALIDRGFDQEEMSNLGLGK